MFLFFVMAPHFGHLNEMVLMGIGTDPFPPGTLGSGCLVHVLREETPNFLKYHTFLS